MKNTPNFQLLESEALEAFPSLDMPSPLLWPQHSAPFRPSLSPESCPLPPGPLSSGLHAPFCARICTAALPLRWALGHMSLPCFTAAARGHLLTTCITATTIANNSAPLPQSSGSDCVSLPFLIHDSMCSNIQSLPSIPQTHHADSHLWLLHTLIHLHPHCLPLDPPAFPTVSLSTLQHLP